MSTPLKPLGDRVIAVAEATKNQTASGFYLPDNAKEKSKIADVVAVGPDAKQIKLKDKIIYKEHYNTEVKIDGTDYIIVKEEDILATLA